MIIVSPPETALNAIGCGSCACAMYVQVTTQLGELYTVRTPRVARARQLLRAAGMSGRGKAREWARESKGAKEREIKREPVRARGSEDEQEGARESEDKPRPRI